MIYELKSLVSIVYTNLLLCYCTIHKINHFASALHKQILYRNNLNVICLCFLTLCIPVIQFVYIRVWKTFPRLLYLDERCDYPQHPLVYTIDYRKVIGLSSKFEVRNSDDKLRFKEYLICRPEADMDAKSTENVHLVRGTGKDFVLQFIKLTLIYILYKSC